MYSNGLDSICSEIFGKRLREMLGADMNHVFSYCSLFGLYLNLENEVQNTFIDKMSLFLLFPELKNYLHSNNVPDELFKRKF